MIVIHTGTDKIERRFIVHLITLKDLEYAQKNKPNDLVFISATCSIVGTGNRMSGANSLCASWRGANLRGRNSGSGI